MSWNMVRNSEKREKGETHMVGTGIRPQTVKNLKNEK
jgi:hypothetical protein